MWKTGILFLLVVGAAVCVASERVIICSHIKSDSLATCIFNNIEIGLNETDVTFKVDEKEAYGNEDISTVIFEGTNKIEKFPSGIFSSFGNLVGLSIKNAGIKVIDNESFINAIRLKDLDLEGNLLSSLPNDLFKNSKKLKTINLNRNPFSGTFDVSIFKGLPLVTLSMQATSITKLMGSFGEGSSLIELDFTDSQIQSIDSSVFQNLRNLESLFLNGNPLEILRANQFKGITRLQDSKLKLDKLSIKRMDASCFNGMHSSILSLSGNKLTVINAYQFQAVEDLKQLYLDKNRLRTLDEKSFNGLGKLDALNLNDNELVFLPLKVFDDLYFLEWLQLANNKINYLQPTIFIKLKNLRQLHLENNQLEYFSDVTISYTNLARVVLNNNRLIAVTIEHLNGKLKFQFSLKENICIDYEHMTSSNWSILLEHIKNCSVVDYYASQVERLMDLYDDIDFDLNNKLESFANFF